VLQREMASREERDIAEALRTRHMETVGQSQQMSARLVHAEGEIASLQAQTRNMFDEITMLRDGDAFNESDWQACAKSMQEQVQNMRRESTQMANMHSSEVETLKHRFGHAEGLLHRESGTAQRLRESALSYRGKLTVCEREVEAAHSSTACLQEEIVSLRAQQHDVAQWHHENVASAQERMMSTEVFLQSRIHVLESEVASFRTAPGGGDPHRPTSSYKSHSFQTVPNSFQSAPPK